MGQPVAEETEEEKTEPRSIFTTSVLPEIPPKMSHEKQAEKPVRCVTRFSFLFHKAGRSCGKQCQRRELSPLEQSALPRHTCSCWQECREETKTVHR